MTAEPPFDFFYDDGSCSLAVRIVLEELELSYVAHRVAAKAGDDDASQPGWRARNPKGRVPALAPVPGRAGGEALLLTEVPAIMTYLSRLSPALDLVPADPAREARTAEWLAWLSGWVHGTAFGGLWRPGRFAEDAAAQAAIAAKGRENVLSSFASIEGILADGRRWAVPDAYTVADAYLLVFYRWGSVLGIDMLRYPNWAELMGRVLERPAVQRAFAGDRLDVPLVRSNASLPQPGGI